MSHLWFVVNSHSGKFSMRNNKGINLSVAKRVLDGIVMKELRPKNRMQDEETLHLK